MIGHRFTRGYGLVLGGLMTVTGAVAEPASSPAGRGGMHSLSDFGPVGQKAEIVAAFSNATRTLSGTGGVLALSPEESKLLNVENSYQRSFRIPAPPESCKQWGTGVGFTIVEVGEKTTTIKVPQMSGIELQRTQRMSPDDSLPHWTTDHMLKMQNNLISGANSYLDVITDPVEKGKDRRFYVKTIRGIRPGQFLNAAAGPWYQGNVERLYVKSVGYDAERQSSYFIADASIDHAKNTFVHNKNNVGMILMEQNCNSDEQTYDVMLKRKQYAGGDTYMFFAWYDYMSDIHSAAGDENGTLFGAYTKTMINNFRAKVETVDWTANSLTFKEGKNVETLGNSRPLINMNPKKWVSAGKVMIVPPDSQWLGTDSGKYSWKGKTYPSHAAGSENLFGGLIRGDKDCPWDSSLVGRFFAVTEESEAVANTKTLYRWYEILGVTVNPDGTKDLAIRRFWWGAKQAGSPMLYRLENGTWDGHERPLRYAIAPAAYVNDVSKAVPVGKKPAGTVLGMAPGSAAGTPFDFAAGDEVEQAIGPDPFKPIPFRIWMWDGVPGAFPAPVFDLCNYGVQRYTALQIRGGVANADDVSKAKDQKPAWENVITIETAAEVGLNCSADFTRAAILFQQPFHEQPVKWLYRPESNQPPQEATLTVSRDAGQLTFSGSARFAGLSGEAAPARNLRGKNIPVPAGATELAVAFPVAEADGDYSVFVEQNWLGNRAVTAQTAQGFTVAFDKSAPAGAKLHWLIVR
jgi:hypothetical protein